MRQLRIVFSLLGLAIAGSAARAQEQAVTGACATPDSIAFRGESHVHEDDLRSGVGITPKTTLNGRVLARAMKDLYATGQFEAIATSCEQVEGKSILVFTVQERRILSDVKVEGPDKVSPSSVRDRVDL